MLTYSSDPLPQIVFPMDEDAIPPNSFCSAPPHHEPSPPLLPLSSTTPSCANDGNSGYRRSGRIQAQTPQKQSNTDRQALQRTPRQNQSHQKRLWVAESMVQASHSEQPKVESTHGHEKQNKEGFDFIAAAQGQNKQNDQGNPPKEPSVTAAENLEEQFADSTAHDLHTIKFPMDTSGGLAVGHSVENTSVPKGWVIGPLFQSLKSKMASLTEIVMTPVKLFRANSPPPSMDHPDKSDECVLKAEGEPSEPSDMFQPVAQSETGNQDITGKEEEIPQIAKYSKKLLFDVEMLTRRSEVADECAVKERSSLNSVHLQHSSFPCSKEEPVESSDLLQPYVDASASKESKLKIPLSMEDQEGKLDQLKPLPRVCIGNKRKGTTKTLASRLKKKSDMEVIDEQVSHLDLVNSNQAKSVNNTSVSLTFSDCSEKDLPDGKSDDCRKMESCVMVRPNLRKSSNESVKGRKPKPTLALQLLDTETISAAGVGRAKRERKLDCYSEDIVKRKRLTEDKCTKRQELLNVASETGVLIGLRSSRKEVVFPNTFVDVEKKLKPPRKRPAASARANKVKVVQNEAEVKTQTECLSDVMSVCLVDESSGLAENTQKGSIIKVKPPASSKRVKTRTDLIESDGNLDSCMDLETTLAITEPKLSDTLVRPEIKQLQCTSRCRNIKGQPLKRKSPNQGGSITETDSTSVSASSPALLVEPVKLTPTDFNDSHGQKEERRKMEPKQPSKRLKMSLRGAIKSSASNGNEETKQRNPSLQLITKGAQSLEGRNKILVDSVTEETPFESEPVPPLAQPQLECYVHLDRLDEKRVNISSEDVAKVHYSVVDDDFPTDTEASIHKSINVSRSLSRGVTIRPRRVDKQRTRCRVLHSRPNKGANVSNSITQDDADLATRSSDSGSSRSLLRSYSCPEILSLRHHDTPWTSSMHSPHLSRIHTSNQHHTPLVYHTHKAQRRARRHTVCSLEVEREIAPLCLRKEVYPSRRSLPYDSSTQHLPPSLALSPTTSLTALASCFLSSPLAFLSKKFDSRPATSPSTTSHVSSPTASASVYPLSPSTWRLPGFLQRTESNCGTSDSSRSADPLECEIERIQQSEEEDDGGDTSSSSQEFEDAALREEKSLSDSEIKVVKKHEERGKVSSIRIRKTLPKAQNNLTPMGLPKPVRLKKKEFSLEEIYTNKNFIQPPESRLETIFEVPLNRRNGSESWFGQRRLKRFLEFLEVGEARKPKKPLVGVGKANNSTSRTRRGGFPKDEPSLSMQDVDSLLCAKLDQLNLWLIHDQRDS